MMSVTLAEALEQMRTGPFEITYVKADRRRRSAGKMRTLQGVALVGEDRANAIRRVMLPSGAIRPVHIRLITYLNGKRVIY